MKTRKDGSRHGSVICDDDLAELAHFCSREHLGNQAWNLIVDPELSPLHFVLCADGFTVRANGNLAIWLVEYAISKGLYPRQSGPEHLN
jgi:hypothetical protein